MTVGSYYHFTFFASKVISPVTPLPLTLIPQVIHIYLNRIRKTHILLTDITTAFIETIKSHTWLEN